ncbi:hypothetical protein BpHYR1_030185 [Brachionus plicatilis]|uniref:Uncharacterized protein n=1 Tax=Brachionus plicatilis TaxID=10195 RepID=A0A3M7Q4A9_BRAPC|nr:hypothetical protein BpHYR1_030185 [Brachionus plicatilis]
MYNIWFAWIVSMIIEILLGKEALIAGKIVQYLLDEQNAFLQLFDHLIFVTNLKLNPFFTFLQYLKYLEDFAVQYSFPIVNNFHSIVFGIFRIVIHFFKS